jgi:hypothetical protein
MLMMHIKHVKITLIDRSRYLSFSCSLAVDNELVHLEGNIAQFVNRGDECGGINFVLCAIILHSSHVKGLMMIGGRAVQHKSILLSLQESSTTAKFASLAWL